MNDWGNVECWASRKPASWIEAAAKVRATRWSRIDGSDNELDPKVAGVADPNLYAGKRIITSGLVKFLYGNALRHAVSLEAGVPVHQDLNGPQPKLDYELNLNYVLEF